MAVVLSRRASEIDHFYFHPYVDPLVYPEQVVCASHFPNIPASTEMYNVRGEYGFSNVYGYHASLNLNDASQPPSMGAYPPQAPLYSVPPTASSATAPPFGPPLVSDSGMIVVVDYTPTEGEANIPITVNLELRAGEADKEDSLGHGMSITSLKLRLVLGRTAVKTTVKRLPPMLHLDGEGPEPENVMRLRLHAFAPPHSEVRFPEQFCVPMTIQAMDMETEVVESFTFGSFTYWTPTTIRPASTVDPYKFPDLTVPFQLKRKREDDDVQGYPQLTQSEPSYALDSPKKALTAHHQREMVLKLVRTTNAPAEALSGGAEAHTAELEWILGDHTPHPNTMDKRWSAYELEIGRRLIRFRREQSGNKLLVSCEIISQEAYDIDDIVISCVYRQETRNCWFTSVDVIYLLERLVGNPFSVEEKNRIRRNLEGFKPTTVSKHKPGYEMFFQRIMDFPPPKPRNIEKDVKVFPWSVLVQALDKIISKYSVIPREASDSSPESSSPSSSGQVGRASRSRSGSSLSQSLSDGPVLVKPLKTVHSQQSLHPLVESPPMLPTEPTSYIPEPEAPALPMDQLYSFPHPPDLSFSDSDHWRRRNSLISLATTSASTRTDDYYSEPAAHDVTPTPMHAYAFSNPLASNVNLAALSLEGHPASAGLHGALGSETPIAVGAPTMGIDASLVDGAFSRTRRSSASELQYPGSDGAHSGPHDTMVSTPYGSITPLDQDVSNDLYAQFSAGNHLPLEDA